MWMALLTGALLIILGGSLYALVALSRQILGELSDFQGSIPLGEFRFLEAELTQTPRVPLKPQ